MRFAYSEQKVSELKSQKWDVIIIGSGLGGMTSATLLAKAGKKVLLLERHTIPGGFTHTFKRGKFEWDVGVHYVGSIDQPNSILRRVIDYVSDEKLKWDAMDDLYDESVIAGDHYHFVKGLSAQLASLTEKFPEEKSAIENYYKLIRKVAGSGPWFFGEKTMPFFLSATLGRLLRWRFEGWAKRTTLEVIRSFTANEKLIGVLCTQCGDYGLSPAQSSFGIHAIVVDHYLNGGSYPRGGAGEIPRTVLASFEASGGTLVTHAEVEKIIIRDHRAVGVLLNDGIELFAPAIVSNAGVRNTLRFLPSTSRALIDPHNAITAVKPSFAHVCLYLGLSSSAEELKIPKHNIWIYNQYDFDAGLRTESADPTVFPPLIYISFPSAKDSRWNDSHPQASATVQIIAPCPYAYVAQWENTKWHKRGEDYEKFKARFSATLLEALLKQLPQLKGHIVYSELSTPLSTRHFSGYQSGEIYGLEHTPARFRLRMLRPQTRIKGLFLTGQDIVTVGVGGALYSGVLTATVILKKSVIARILFKRKLR